MYSSYREFSVKEELREAKPPSIEGSVVTEHATLESLSSAYMDDVMPTDKQTQNLTNRDLVGYTQ